MMTIQKLRASVCTTVSTKTTQIAHVKAHPSPREGIPGLRTATSTVRSNSRSAKVFPIVNTVWIVSTIRVTILTKVKLLPITFYTCIKSGYMATGWMFQSGCMFQKWPCSR